MYECMNYSGETKYYDDSNKLVVGKTKDETGSVAIKALLDWSQRCIHSW